MWEDILKTFFSDFNAETTNYLQSASRFQNIYPNRKAIANLNFDDVSNIWRLRELKQMYLDMKTLETKHISDVANLCQSYTLKTEEILMDLISEFPWELLKEKQELKEDIENFKKFSSLLNQHRTYVEHFIDSQIRFLEWLINNHHLIQREWGKPVLKSEKKQKEMAEIYEYYVNARYAYQDSSKKVKDMQKSFGWLK